MEARIVVTLSTKEIKSVMDVACRKGTIGIKLLEDTFSETLDTVLKDPWYTECWYDDDIIAALEAAGIPATPRSIAAMREACKDIFWDKTYRNEMLRDKAEELFCR